VTQESSTALAARQSPALEPPSWLGIASARHAAFHVVIVVTLARLVFADSLGLGEDGAYSAAIARHFSWSYYDHGPMHYWLVGLTEWLTGSTAPVILRLPFILLSAGSSWLLFELTTVAFGDRAGLWATIGFSLCLFFLLLPLYVGPDGPLVFFLLLAALLVARILFVNSPRAHLMWTAAGLAGGAALLSKYSAILFFVGVFLFLVSSPAHRRRLATPGPWLGVAAASLVFVPVIIWNWEHAWISLLFQGGRATQLGDGGLASLAKGVLSQFGYLAPYFMPFLLVALLRALAGGPHQEKHWFFACLSILPITMFTAMDLFHPGLPHWSMPGWLFAFPLLGAATAGLTPEGLRRARRVSVTLAMALAFTAAAFVAYVRAGYFDWPVRLALAPRAYVGNDVLREFFDWREIEPILIDRGLLADNAQVVAALTWQTTGRVDQVFGDDRPVLCLCLEPNHFRFARDLNAFAGASVLIIDRPDHFLANEALLNRAFSKREPLPPIVLRRGVIPTVILRIERASGFRPGAIAWQWQRALSVNAHGP
jgi:hypothetical protein